MPAYFIFTSYATLSDGAYLIDKISSMYIQAEQGVCTIDKFYPTDGNYKIYGVAASWTVQMFCEHAFDTTYGVRITFPQDWYIIESLRCEVKGQSTSADCKSSKSTRTITIKSLFKSATKKK